MNIQDVAAEFKLEGDICSIEKVEAGLINNTYRVRCERGGYILQKVNTEVFPDVDAVMENVAAVLDHLSSKVSDRDRLRLILTKTDRVLFFDEADAWRCYNEIENTVSIDAVSTPEQAYAAGMGFGRFFKMLQDFPAEKLKETIPDFHNTPVRYEQFKEAYMIGDSVRRTEIKNEYKFISARVETIYLLADYADELPIRVVHNDTKISNILFDSEDGSPRCVIDLDTVMPGSALHDFGDLVRSSVTGQAEGKGADVVVRKDIFDALVKGYFEEALDVLTDKERSLLLRSAEVITLELGMRFLTDYLLGDSYFGTSYEGENLDRARKQFQLVQALEDSNLKITTL